MENNYCIIILFLNKKTILFFLMGAFDPFACGLIFAYPPLFLKKRPNLQKNQVLGQMRSTL